METKRTRALLAACALFCVGAILVGCSSGDLAGIFGGGGKVTFTTGQAAVIAIGQADLTSKACPNPPNGSSLCGSYSSPFVTSTGTLIIPDEGNNRTLIYNSVPTASGAAAAYALQQPDLVSNSSGISATQADCSEQAIVANGKMIQADYCNDRIIIYNNGIPGSSPGTIDVVVGQVNKTSKANTCDAVHLNNPESMAVVNGRLYVTDGSHNRILIWNSIPTSDGTPADVVIGQPNMTSCADNAGNASPSANTFSYPDGMWSDGSKLVVDDCSNNRVLIWNTVPTSNQAANVVLGQPDFTSNGAPSPPTASSMSCPYDGVYFTSAQLFITDSENNRVLIWNTFPTTNGQPADVVLGQTSMTTNSTGTTASTLDSPAGVFLIGKQLIVSDTTNNRYVIYQGH